MRSGSGLGLGLGLGLELGLGELRLTVGHRIEQPHFIDERQQDHRLPREMYVRYVREV